MIVFTAGYQTIGILGGMGPEATAQFYKEVVRECQRKYSAKYDFDYPEMILYNLPLPDVVEKPTEQDSIIALLKYGLRKLEAAGAEFIVAPCNTINAFCEETRRCVSIPVYSIIDVTARKVSASGIKRAGIVGTQLTLKTGLYDKALQKYGVETLKPTKNEAAAITTVILNILGGNKNAVDKTKLLAIISRMKRAGAQSVVLGCTELSLILTQEEAEVPLFDTLKILAEFTVLEARTGRSGVEAACWPVKPKGRVRAPDAALNKNYLSQLQGR